MCTEYAYLNSEVFDYTAKRCDGRFLQLHRSNLDESFRETMGHGSENWDCLWRVLGEGAFQ